MGNFSLSGGVEVTGFISPTNPLDEYPVIDPLYGIDGFRNVNLLSDLNTIPELRRRAGMVVGVSGGTDYYKLLPNPWNYTISDWSIFNSGGGGSTVFTGGTVSGDTIFTQGLSANTFSATTYLGLPLDVYVTGGTYSNGTTTFINNTGGTFDVLGYYTGETDNNTFTTGFTYQNNTFTISDNSGSTFDATIDTVTGLTVNGTFSATTYLGLPLDVYVTGLTFNTSNYDITIGRNDGVTFTDSLSILATDLTVTGGTYDPLNGTATFTNNTGGTFNVTGFITGFTDIQVTGYTYQDNTFTIFDSSGNTFSATIDVVTGLTVNGTISATTYQNLPQDIFVTGGTYTNGEILFRNNAGSYFTVTGLPIGGAGGQVYYLNLSQTQTPYQEFSPIGTNLTEQTTGVTINSGVTSTIASFLTPVGYPNATTIPAGYWSFYIHSYKDVVNASFDVFCEVYTYTTGGTETLILTTEGADVTTYSPTVSMELTDGYYSGGTIDITDRILVKVRTTNNGSQTNTLTFFTEGQQHYSYGITPFSNFNALTCETLSGCTTIVNLENNKVDKSGDTMTGTLYVPTISATTYQNLPGSTSTNCITDFYVSNIYSCGTLYINPNDENDVWIGSISLFVDSSTYHVGVGIAPPQARLHVNNTSSDNSFLVEDNTNPDSTPFVIDSIGNTGIGTSTPQFKLDVDGTSAFRNYTRVYAGAGNIVSSISWLGTDSGIINLYSGGTSTAQLNTNGVSYLNGGNVGIGITLPTEKLDVIGKTKTINLQVTSGATTGYVLTSDASGNATWQTPTTFTGGTVSGLTATTISASTISAPGSTTQVIYNNGGVLSADTGFVYTGNKITLGQSGATTASSGEIILNRFTTGTNVGGIRAEQTGNGVEIGGSSYYDKIMTTNGAGIRFWTWVTGTTSNAERMRITSGTGTTWGVGINTTTPAATLHVAGTNLMSAATQNVLTIVGSGNSTTSPIFTVQGSSGELFSVSDSLTGSLFSVNDISGLPILEVFSDNTTLMGSYLAPSLNTTSRVIATTGTTNVYSIPTSAYTGAFFDYTVSDGTNLRAGNIMSIWSGSSVNMTETQTTDFGNTSGITFNMVVSSGNAILRTSGITGNWTVKTIVRSI